MANVQPNYNTSLTAALAGQVAYEEPHQVVTREAQNAAGVVFGAVVARGTGDHQCQPGGTGATNFLGIAVLDPTVRAENNNQYAQYDSVGVLIFGAAWVVAAVAVTPGQQAYFDASGNITNVATSNTIMPNCFFDSTAGVGALVRLRMK